MQLLDHDQTAARGAAGLGSALNQRAEFLTQSDRTMLVMTLVQQVSRRKVAALLGIHTGTISRRLRRVLNLLHDPYVVALIEHGQLLPDDYRDMALDYELRDLSLRAIARKFGLPKARVRSILTYCRAWFGAQPGGKGRQKQATSMAATLQAFAQIR